MSFKLAKPAKTDEAILQWKLTAEKWRISTHNQADIWCRINSDSFSHL